MRAAALAAVRVVCLFLVACHVQRAPATELRRQHERALSMAAADEDGSSEVLVIDARRAKPGRSRVAAPGPTPSR